ncbi:UNVERIFIED_CONTAM: hypothetical protein FKN15_053706 [Acipenser sinensis]
MALNATRLDNVTLGMFTNNTASYALSAVYIIVFCINLPGNGFSLWLLLFHTKPKTPSIIFMINLTITDLALCMFLPFQIAYLINSYDWIFGETLCSLVSVMFYSNMYCSILTMTAISVERYFGVVHPMRFDCKRTRYALAACLAMWGIVLLYFLLYSQMEYDVFDFYEETKVKFADLSEELLWEYIHSGEPMDKAGGYGIQALGGMLVEYVHGDFLNVVGFPLNHFCKKLAEIYNPPPKSEIRHTKYESIPNVETFDNPGDLESGLERHTENGEAIRIGNQPGDQDNRSISHHCTAVSVEAQDSSKGPVEFPPNIADLLDGFKASKTLFVASKLKVFDLLNHHGSLKVGEVADKLQTSVVGTERLLDGCVALGLLEKTHQLDSLGCTGAMAYELVKMYPDLTITVYDLPAVIEMSSHFRPHKQDTHQVTFTAGDFFKDDLPKADLYILSRVLHDWSEDKIDVLLSKISQICTPGCGLLVAEIVLHEQRRSPTRALLQALSMTEGKQRSGSEYSQLLQKYAFTEIQPKHTGNFLDAILFIKQ